MSTESDMRMTQCQSHEQYADYYFLRSIDLIPERLGDDPFLRRHMPHLSCEHFVEQGWLFRTKEEAEAVYHRLVNAIGRRDILLSR